MKIMLTGATGYLGRTIALKAAEANHRIHALVRSTGGASNPHHENIEYFKGDLSDMDVLKAAMPGSDEVIHCAAIAKMWTRERAVMYKEEVEGTRNTMP